MNTFTTLRQIRKNILSVIEAYDNEQLNYIPEGFNNNLIWNLGHVIITQQLLCYKLSNLQVNVNPDLVDRYRKGSKPEGPVSDEEIELIKGYTFSTVDKMEADYKAGLFKEYKEYSTSFGLTLSNSEQAMEFNNAHEGMHLGFVLALKKFIPKR